MKISVLFLMLIIISGISLIGINQAFALFCSSNVAGSWNAPSTWTGCGGGVPDDTGDTAFINQNGDVQLNNNFVVGSVEIIQGGNLFINCNGELIITFVAESGSNAGLLTNHGILQTLTQVDFTNTGTYQSSGTDIFGGPFTGNAIVPIASICPVCGDGIVEPPEDCDDLNLPTPTCDINCKFIPIGCQIDADCNDSNACTTDVCNTLTGQCSNTAIVCDDNDACNGLETCDPATGCVAGTPLVCDDGLFCTLDSCNPASGCVFAPNPDPSCERVGGEFLGVDSTALLMAGFQANALWLIPAIVAVVGIGIILARKF